MYFIYILSYSFGFFSGCCCKNCFLNKDEQRVERNTTQRNELRRRYINYLENIIFNSNQVTTTEINIIDTEASLTPLALINEEKINENVNIIETLPEAEIIR